MARRYILPFTAVTVVAGNLSDLAGFTAAAGKFARLLRVWLQDIDTPLPAATLLSFRIAAMSNVTRGAGSTVKTPELVDWGDAAATSAGWIGPSTALATTAGGSNVNKWPLGCHINQGLDVTFTEPFPALGGEAYVLQMDKTQLASVILSGGMLFEEIGT